MKEVDEFLALKIRLFKATLILFGLMAFVMSIARFYEQSYLQCAIDISLLLVIVIGYIKLQAKDQNFYMVFRVVLFFGFLAAFGMLIVISQSPMRFMWFSTVVYIMFYILGKREGWWWAGIVALILLTLFIYDNTILGLDKKEFFTWIFNMFIILIVVNWYEKIKESALEKQKNIQSLLHKEVDVKTAELQNINNILEKQKNIFKSDAKRFHDIYDQIPGIAVQGYDEQHKVIYWNRTSEDFYGYSRQEAYGKKLEDLIIPETMQEEVSEAINNWINNGIKIPSAEIILKDRNNLPVTVFSQHVLIETEDGNKEMYCLDIDLRQIKKTEEKLRQSEQALQALNDNLEKNIEIAVADLKKSQEQAKLGSWKYNIIDDELTWSDETYHIFELEKNTEVISYEKFLASIHPEDIEKVNAAYASSLKTKDPYKIIHRIVMTDGRIKYVKEHCETTFDSDGNALVSIGTVQDISSEYFAAEKLREKENILFKQSRLAQMGEMISMIAHQWRQPLSAISSTVNTLILKNERGNYESELFENKLQEVANYSQHLSTTIDDFRNFFKVYKEKEKTTIEAIIEDVLNITQTSLESKKINIITDFNYNKKVEIYANELKQVILNLIKNSEDVLLGNKVINPEITVRTFEENGYCVLTIEDNGGGIDDAIIDKVFDPYFSTKLDKEGTGLGLYMSKIIVQEHCAGTLTVNNGPNGAVFSIEMKAIDV